MMFYYVSIFVATIIVASSSSAVRLQGKSTLLSKKARGKQPAQSQEYRTVHLNMRGYTTTASDATSAVRLQGKPTLLSKKARGKQPQSSQEHGTVHLNMRGNSSAGNSSRNDAMNSTSNIRESNRRRVARGYYRRSIIKKEKARKARFFNLVKNKLNDQPRLGELLIEDLIADGERLPDDMEEELEHMEEELEKQELAAMQMDKAAQDEIEGLLQDDDDNVRDLFMEPKNQELTKKAAKEVLSQLLELKDTPSEGTTSTWRSFHNCLKDSNSYYDLNIEDLLEMIDQEKDTTTGDKLKDVDQHLVSNSSLNSTNAALCSISSLSIHMSEEAECWQHLTKLCPTIIEAPSPVKLVRQATFK